MANSSSKEDNIRRANYASIFLSASMTAATHPVQMAKVMIQIGFEPGIPTPYTTILGKEMFRLPGLFAYASVIYKVDGVLGLFRGVTPRIASAVLSSALTNSMMHGFHNCCKQSDDDESEQESQSQYTMEEFVRETCYQSVARVTSTIVTYPLEVVSLRMIIQFIGRETKYTGVMQSVREIYNDEGFSGLFAGLIPRLIGDLITLWIFRGLTFWVNKAVSTEIGDFKDLKVYTQQASQIIVSSLTYPFVLVSNFMAVNECGLQGANHLPTFTGWINCWGMLRENKMSWRGSSVFRRTSSTGDVAPLSFRKLS